MHTGCPHPAAKGKRKCSWHWLLGQPIQVQIEAAQRRLSAAEASGAPYRARVPKEQWPPGQRWCAGCQSMIPLFYATGSRCRACSSGANHARHVEKTYGITADDYAALLAFQGGVCYICRRKPRAKRLAVDHDHQTGEVRGLLCANNENGCNRGVVANLEAAGDGGLAAARRAVEYLEDPPYARLREHRQSQAPGFPVRYIVGVEPPPPF